MSCEEDTAYISKSIVCIGKKLSASLFVTAICEYLCLKNVN